MGIPEMELFWQDLLSKRKTDQLSAEELILFKRLSKVVILLSENPRHPSLRTHEIPPLSKKHGITIWQSYLDQGAQANRVYWAYGPERREITILGIEPHPEDGKRGAYERIKLSDLP
jgi:hypothetical protein